VGGVEPEALAWRVFRSAFRDGEHVVVETDDGKFHWGRLRAENDVLVLTRPNGESEEVDWDEVEFVSHDGFPVSAIAGLSVLQAENAAQLTNRDLIVAALEGRTHFGGGCPWWAGPAELVAVHNRGSRSLKEDCETLVFRAADGALMHSYDTGHLFLEESLP
jgi:hypothetical protein